MAPDSTPFQGGFQVHVTDEDLASQLSGQVEGEEGPLLDAVYARVTTAASFAHWLSPIGNYFIARPAARAHAHKVTEETDLPLDAGMVFGLGNSALHVWRADPMLNQVHKYLGHFPLQRITAMKATPEKGWQKLSMTLDGSHQVELEARGAVHALVESPRV